MGANDCKKALNDGGNKKLQKRPTECENSIDMKCKIIAEKLGIENGMDKRTNKENNCQRQ